MGFFFYKMSCHYNKLTEVINDLAKDIMTISDLTTEVTHRNGAFGKFKFDRMTVELTGSC